MLKLKTADFFVQLILIVILLLMYAFEADNSSPLPWLITLAMVQIISIATHLFIGPRDWKSKLRYWHHILTAGVIILIVVGLAIPREDKYDSGGAELLIISLLPSALLAVFYLVITGIEWGRMQRWLKQKEREMRR